MNDRETLERAANALVLCAGYVLERGEARDMAIRLREMAATDQSARIAQLEFERERLREALIAKQKQAAEATSVCQRAVLPDGPTDTDSLNDLIRIFDCSGQREADRLTAEALKENTNE